MTLYLQNQVMGQIWHKDMSLPSPVTVTALLKDEIWVNHTSKYFESIFNFVPAFINR